MYSGPSVDRLIRQIGNVNIGVQDELQRLRDQVREDSERWLMYVDMVRIVAAVLGISVRETQ